MRNFGGAVTYGLTVEVCNEGSSCLLLRCCAGVAGLMFGGRKRHGHDGHMNNICMYICMYLHRHGVGLDLESHVVSEEVVISMDVKSTEVSVLRWS